MNDSIIIGLNNRDLCASKLSVKVGLKNPNDIHLLGVVKLKAYDYSNNIFFDDGIARKASAREEFEEEFTIDLEEYCIAEKFFIDIETEGFKIIRVEIEKTW